MQHVDAALLTLTSRNISGSRLDDHVYDDDDEAEPNDDDDDDVIEKKL